MTDRDRDLLTTILHNGPQAFTLVRQLASINTEALTLLCDVAAGTVSPADLRVRVATLTERAELVHQDALEWLRPFVEASGDG